MTGTTSYSFTFRDYYLPVTIAAFIIFIFLISSNTNRAFGQTLWFPVGNWNFRVDVDEDLCHHCEAYTIPLLGCYVSGGISFGPDGLEYGIGYDITEINHLYQFNPDGGACTWIMDGPPGLPIMGGMVAMANGIFYSMSYYSDTLYKWDANAGTVNVVGTTGFPLFGEMCLSNGVMYYVCRETFGPYYSSIIQLDYVNPSNSFRKVSMDPQYGLFGITATGDPGYLFAEEIWIAGGDVDLYRLSLVDGSIEYLCQINPPPFDGGFNQITSPLEHDQLPPTPPYIDLDCDDSSGAIESDYNGVPYNCLAESGVGICDDDPRIRTDAVIAQLTCKITPFNPDAPGEVLGLSGGPTGINVVGDGTSMLTLSNAGNATIQNFQDALKLVVYQNLSYDITPGIRTIEVKFTNVAGAQSNIGKAYIDVVEIPPLQLDLGPDLQPCEGETVTLYANYPGGDYLWSTGEESESIVVDQPGSYSVTVSDDSHCPDRDTVEVQYVPIIQLWLTGDTAVCKGSPASLTLTNDAGFPISVVITQDPGTPILLEDIPGVFTFSQIPPGNTEYQIDDVTLSQPACVLVPDQEQIIEVWPVFSGINDSISICQGDSILLGNQYYDTSGVFPITLHSIHNCDSLVNYSISLLPTEHLYYNQTSCDPSQAGTVLSFLPNPNGCDTVVHTTTTLLHIDTVNQIQLTCLYAQIGTLVDTFTNQFGCDSFIITSIIYNPPNDTTQIQQYTCDSSAVGIFYQTQVSSLACDSIIQVTISIPEPDTTRIFATSCDTAAAGMMSSILNGINGCDSIVITTTILVTNDTTYAFTTSCDSADLGTFLTTFPIDNSCDSIVITQVSFSLSDTTYLTSGSCFSIDTGLFVTHWNNHQGCDSTVIQNVSLYPSHQVNLAATSCMPSDTGLFTQMLVNRFGCDSIINTHVALLPSHATSINSKTCDAQQAGVIVSTFQNQYGCDSIVTETITYLPPDTIVLTKYTCDSLAIGVAEIHLNNQFGCDSLIRDVTALFPLPLLDIYSAYDYHGFEISCHGVQDGGILATYIAVTPLQFQWSTGSSQDSINNLSAGEYALLLTDGNGCLASDEIILSEPPPLSIHLLVSEPDCFQQGLGTIQVEASGGVAPYLYSLDNVSYVDAPIFNDLENGSYTVNVQDANGCEASEIIAVHVPIPVHVDLGDNQVIDFGDSASLLAVVNVPYATLQFIQWNGLDSIPCPTCLEQIIIPFITTSYAIEVINDDGCRDEDEVTITVNKNEDIFVPNIFSPNGDGSNDEVIVYAGSYVRIIREFNIYDRWGNNVFSATDFTPNNPSSAWDGNFHGKLMNPGVYAYRLVAEFYDNRQVVRFGDITLIR